MGCAGALPRTVTSHHYRCPDGSFVASECAVVICLWTERRDTFTVLM